MSRADVSREQLAATLQDDRTQDASLGESQSLPDRFKHRVLFGEEPGQR